MKEENKKEYIVSWSPILENCIYGKDIKNNDRSLVTSFTYPMTIFQARKRGKELHGKNVGIYKLVLIERLTGIRTR